MPTSRSKKVTKPEVDLDSAGWLEDPILTGALTDTRIMMKDINGNCVWALTDKKGTQKEKDQITSSGTLNKNKLWEVVTTSDGRFYGKEPGETFTIVDGDKIKADADNTVRKISAPGPNSIIVSGGWNAAVVVNPTADDPPGFDPNAVAEVSTYSEGTIEAEFAPTIATLKYAGSVTEEGEPPDPPITDYANKGVRVMVQDGLGELADGYIGVEIAPNTVKIHATPYIYVPPDPDEPVVMAEEEPDQEWMTVSTEIEALNLGDIIIVNNYWFLEAPAPYIPTTGAAVELGAEPAFEAQGLSVQGNDVENLLLNSAGLANWSSNPSNILITDMGDTWWKLEDINNAGGGSASYTYTKDIADLDTYCIAIDVKKDSGTWPWMFFRFLIGSKYGDIYLNNSTGEVREPTTSKPDNWGYVVEDFGTFWRMHLWGSDPSPGASTTIKPTIYPAYYDGSGFSTVHVGYQLVRNCSITKTAFPVSYTPTVDVPVTTAAEADVLVAMSDAFKQIFSQALGGGEGTVVFDIMYRFNLNTNVNILSISSNNGLLYGASGNRGVTNDATTAVYGPSGSVPDTPQRFAIRFSAGGSAKSIAYRQSGVWIYSVDGAFDGDYALLTNLEIMTNSQYIHPRWWKNVRVFDYPLTNEEIEAMP